MATAEIVKFTLGSLSLLQHLCQVGKGVSMSIIAQKLYRAIGTCSATLNMTQISHGEPHSHRPGDEACPYGAAYPVVADHM